MTFFSNPRNRAPQRLQGVSCDVKSCVYHDGEQHCTANRIKVGPAYATAVTDTVCSTYRPKALR